MQCHAVPGVLGLPGQIGQLILMVIITLDILNIQISNFVLKKLNLEIRYIFAKYDNDKIAFTNKILPKIGFAKYMYLNLLTMKDCQTLFES